MLSTLYLGWGYISQQIIADRVEQNLAAQSLPNQQVLVTPTAFNTFLWRVVVMGDGQYWEGLASVLDNDKHIIFISRTLGQWPLEEKPSTLVGLKAFSHNYLNYRVEDNKLIVSDLRLGMANNLSFEFVFAEKDRNGDWELLEATQRYPNENNFDLIAPLWERLKGNQSIVVGL